jgi:hypothetical protein
MVALYVNEFLFVVVVTVYSKYNDPYRSFKLYPEFFESQNEGIALFH